MTVHYIDFNARPREEPGPTRCSALDLELIRLVCELPDDPRAKLLAFLHLARGHAALQADLAVDEAGDLHLTLASTPRDAA